MRPDEDQKKKKLPFRVIARDAMELLHARRGRLTLGFGLLLVSKLCGLVLPGTTKFLLDEVIARTARGPLPMKALLDGLLRIGLIPMSLVQKELEADLGGTR